MNGVYKKSIQDTNEAAQILASMFRKVLNNEGETLTVTLPHGAWLQLYEWLVKIGVCPKGWKDWK